MKPIICALFLFAAAPALAREKTAGYPEITAVLELLQQHADYQSITERLGVPSEESINERGSSLSYKDERKSYRFQLGPDRKVQHFDYRQEGPADTGRLSYEQVKKCSRMHTAAEVYTAFGTPGSVSISKDGMVWQYRSHTRNLSVYFDLAGTQLKKYNYDERNDRQNTEIPREQAERLRKGVSTANELREQLGLPAAISSNKSSEAWTYQGPNTLLILYFDQDARLERFNYQRKSE